MRATWTVISSMLSLALIFGTLSAGALADPSAAEDSAAPKLGRKIADVRFVDAAKKKVALYDFKDKKATVVVFLSFECPNSTGYSPVLADMAKRYTEQGVAFVGICCTEGETAESVAKHAEEFKLGFPVYHDSQAAAVAAFKAETTPEAFLLDHNFVLRYRGRIDDGYAARLKKNLQIKNHDLKNALDEVLAGKPVSRPVTQAVGCAIGTDRSGLAKKSKPGRSVTYYRDVAPILQSRCQECHRPGQVGPFSLTTYKQALTWAQDIKEYTSSRQMPPWKITEGIAFHNERRLSDQEIATLAAWVEGGTPEGDPKDAPLPRKFVEGWRLGQPDLVLSTSEDFVLGPGGRDLFRVFVLPTSLTEDKFVVAFEVKPGNPRVVHHTLNFIDAAGQARQLERKAREKEKNQIEKNSDDKSKPQSDYDRGPGYSVGMGVGFLPQGGMGGWAPGQLPQQLPEGYGFRLPKGSDVVVQVHYHRNGRVERDRLQIGLYFAKKTDGMKGYKTGVLAGRLLAIPPGDANFKVTGSTSVSQDCVLHSIMPHMHLLGRQIKVTMKPTDGPKSTLLQIDAWDYNWQETYFLKEPLKLRAGTVLEVQAVYDNSDANPNNPYSPPRLVTLGEQTTNEMCFVFLGATSDGPGRSPFARPFGGRRPGGRGTAPPSGSGP
jgi:peroxiredoxin